TVRRQGGDGSWWVSQDHVVGRFARRLSLRYRVPKIKSRVGKRGERDGYRQPWTSTGVVSCAGRGRRVRVVSRTGLCGDIDHGHRCGRRDQQDYLLPVL